jgi:lipopolysaccharide/colanic/teichoic acid biosynthesis glycosyltransferase
VVLSVRPGITGPASLKYKNEEVLLETQSNPEQYNNEVIWPDKVKINVDYVNNWSFIQDVRYIYQTITGV